MHAWDADARFCTFRLLLAMPWPAAVLGRRDALNAPALPLARALGALFDATCAPNHFIRNAVNRWVRWAGRASSHILSAWSAGVQRAWESAGGSDADGACVLLDNPAASMPVLLAGLCGYRAPLDQQLAGPVCSDIDGD